MIMKELGQCVLYASNVMLSHHLLDLWFTMSV